MITSPKNEYLKEIRKLHMAKYRKESGRFTVSGFKCVHEALLYGNVESVIYTADMREFAEREADSQSIRKIEVSPQVMETLDEARSPQGIIAVASLKEIEIPWDSVLLIALDDISDPVNLGAIIRTADAVGADGVLLSRNTSDPTSPRAVRSSMGSIFHIPVIRTDDLREELRSLHGRGFSVMGTSLEGSEEIIVPEKTVLVIGNEAHGMSDEMLSVCNTKVRIPMYGKAESLNASVAAGILMYMIKGFIKGH